MKLEYEYSFAEFLAISTCRNRKKGFYNLRELGYWALAAFNISFGMGMFYLLATRAGKFSTTAMLLIMLGVGMFLWRLVFAPFYQKWYYNQNMLKGKTGTVEALPSGLKLTTDDTITTQKWSAIIEANEEPNHFLLWLTKLQAYSIPKSAFTDETQIQNFRELIASNVAKQDLIK